MTTSGPRDRRPERSSRRGALAWAAVLVVLPLGAGLDLRLRSAGVPVPEELAARIAQCEAQVLAMRQLAARGITGDRFVRLCPVRSDSIQSTRGYVARVRELGHEAEAFYRDARGVPYLQGTDPYRWLRRARNIADHGRFGDSVRGGTSWNDLTGVPAGVAADGNAQALAVGLAVKLLRPFGGPSIEAIDSWSPVAVLCIALLFAALLGRSLVGPWGGLLVAMLLALQPAVAERTTAGYADTDSWNLVFALSMTWLLGESIEAGSRRRAVSTGALAALAVGGFAWSWPGWWFVYTSLVAGVIGAVAIGFAAPGAARLPARNAAAARGTRVATAARSTASAPQSEMRQLVRTWALRGGLVLAAAVASVAMLAGGSRLAGLWRESMAALRMSTPTSADAWPNVYGTVGELQPVAFARVRAGLGGEVVVALALAGLFRLVAGPVRVRLLAVASVIGLAVVELASRGDSERGLAVLVLGAGGATVAGIVTALRARRVVPVVPLCLAAWSLEALVACRHGDRFVFLLAPPLAIAAGSLLGDIATRATAAARSTLRRAVVPIVTAAAIVALLVTVRARALRDLSGLVRLPEMNDAWAASFDWLRTQSNPGAVVCTWWDYGDVVTALAQRRVLNDAGSQVTSVSYWMARALATEDPDEARAILRLLCVGGQDGYDVLRRAGVPASRAVELLAGLGRVQASDAVARLVAAGVPEGPAREVAAPLSGAVPEAYLWLSEDLSAKTSSWAHYGNWDFDRAASRAAAVEVQPAVICADAPAGLVTQNGVHVDLPGEGWTGLMRGPRGGAVAIVRRRGIVRAVTLPASVARSLYVRLMYESPRGVGAFDLVWEGQTFLGERVAVYRIRW